jgi:chromate transporter
MAGGFLLQPTVTSGAITMWEVFRVALLLGLTSFGGPTAHLGFFRNEYVARRRWLSEQEYADLVALCQFLPGPASSQVGIAIGTLRAGTLGGIAAWLGFTLPSAVLLTLLGLGLTAYAALLPAGLIHGLQLTAVAVVIQALWSMAQSLCPDPPRRRIALGSAALMLLLPTAIWQIPLIAVGALLGRWLLPITPAPLTVEPTVTSAAALRRAVISSVLFVVLLIGLPLLSALTAEPAAAAVAAYYLTGSLVFGGGHVVLPLLEAQVVAPGWVSPALFAAGYGAAQAVPGPLFTLAAFLGAAAQPFGGVAGALTALTAVFLPALLLVWAALPAWSVLRAQPAAQVALAGVNAVVVGLLLAAFYDPLWRDAVAQPIDAALVLAALAALTQWRVPAWLVVPAGAAVGVLLTALGLLTAA